MPRLVGYEKAAKFIAERSGLPHLRRVEVYVVATGARSRAYARIWGLSKALQEALDLGPLYVIELLKEFWRLQCPEKAKVLAHELAHIPTTTSGALRPHNAAFWRDYKALLRASKDACPLIKEADRAGTSSL